jgi:hypothetical protein
LAGDPEGPEAFAPAGLAVVDVADLGDDRALEEEAPGLDLGDESFDFREIGPVALALLGLEAQNAVLLRDISSAEIVPADPLA